MRNSALSPEPRDSAPPHDSALRIPHSASALTRRQAVGAVAGMVLATLDWTPAEAGRALSLSREVRARAAGQGYSPTFFTSHEWETVRVLVDLIIPKDVRSGSATDAGVPEFMDFLMTDGSDQQRTAMRRGLAWIDIECPKRFGKYLCSQERGKPSRGLINAQQFGIRHQCPANGEHLLFSAGECPRDLVGSILQHGKQLIDLAYVVPKFVFILQQISPRHEIIEHCHFPERPSPLRTKGQTSLDDFMGRDLIDSLSIKSDLTFKNNIPMG